MKIAVIDNYDSFVFNLVRYLRSEVDEVVIFRNDKIDFSELEQADGIVLSPGPGIPLKAGLLMEVIERFEGVKPILGVCLGHQALGEFYGGRLLQCKGPLHGKATVVIQAHPSILLKGLPLEFQVGRYHSWCVEDDLSEELVVTAYSEDGIIMSLQHREKQVYGVQFHPESILTPQGRQIIKNWIKHINKR